MNQVNPRIQDLILDNLRSFHPIRMNNPSIGDCPLVGSGSANWSKTKWTILDRFSAKSGAPTPQGA